MRIRPYSSSDCESVLKLSMRAWAPVFEQMRGAVPHFVYANFYPHGWENRQRSDLSTVLDEEPDSCDVLEVEGSVIGWVSTHIHPEDRMGEIHVIAVDPDHQGRGYGSALITHARARTEEAGMSMVMVETGGDPGHTAGRAAYESAGFRRWPVARYFLEIPHDRPVTSRATVQGPLAAPRDREPSSDPDRHDTFHAPVEDQLVAFIDQHRVMLAGSLEGLSEAEARLQLVPSKTTMLGLLKHAIFVERVWFEEAFSGQTRRQLGIVDGPDESFDLAPRTPFLHFSPTTNSPVNALVPLCVDSLLTTSSAATVVDRSPYDGYSFTYFGSLLSIAVMPRYCANRSFPPSATTRGPSRHLTGRGA